MKVTKSEWFVTDIKTIFDCIVYIKRFIYLDGKQAYGECILIEKKDLGKYIN